MQPPLFATRRCPLCGGRGTTLIAPEAAEFSRTNFTYAEKFRQLLGLDDPARFPIDRCTQCGFVYAAELPPPEFLDVLYDVVIDRDRCIEGSENRSGYARRLRYVADLLDLAPAGDPRALDYGSGLGVTLRIFRTVNVPAIGFDPSALRRDYSGEDVVTGDPNELRRHAPFTIVVLDNVLEHVPDPVATLAFLGEITAAGTVAYVSVPPYDEPFLQRQIAAHREGRPLDMTLNPWEHLNYFSSASLDALMERVGFARIARAEIGLRAETQPKARMKNALASMPRLAKWALRGRALASAEHAFYRRR